MGLSLKGYHSFFLYWNALMTLVLLYGMHVQTEAASTQLLHLCLSSVIPAISQ